MPNDDAEPILAAVPSRSPGPSGASGSAGSAGSTGSAPDDGAPDDLAPGDRGDAVRDLHQRLRAAGYEVVAHDATRYDEHTAAGLRRFQQARGLPETGRCDGITWRTLVEAGFQLGDRMLYLRAPMLRGDDVAELQHRLGTMGFDAGRVDGIFGPDTERALKDFQRNMGLSTDGVLGRDTRATLVRLGDRTARPSTVAGIRERERLRDRPGTLAGRRVAIGQPGGLGILVAAIERRLAKAGAEVLTLHAPDPSAQAQEANGFDAEVFVGLRSGPHDQVWFYENRGFHSHGGSFLAKLIASEAAGRLADTAVEGRWHPLLRETRMPAVQWNLGPTTALSTRSPAIAHALHGALAAWIRDEPAA